MLHWQIIYILIKAQWREHLNRWQKILKCDDRKFLRFLKKTVNTICNQEFISSSFIIYLSFQKLWKRASSQTCIIGLHFRTRFPDLQQTRDMTSTPLLNQKLIKTAKVFFITPIKDPRKADKFGPVFQNPDVFKSSTYLYVPST